MAELASSTSRVILNITSATPAVGWPNRVSTVMDAYLGKKAGAVTEIGTAAGMTPPYKITDIPAAGGIKQNVAMFTFDRYSQFFTRDKESTYGGSGPGGGEHGSGGGGWRTVWYNYANISQHIVEHTPDVDTKQVGISVETYYLNRASHHHQSFAGSYGRLSVVYRTKDAPTVNKTINYGQVIRFGKAWNTSGHLLANPINYVSKTITHSQPIIYVKIIFKMYHGMGNWHSSGDRSPSNWSPARSVCTDLHPVGISSNHWRSITNTRRGTGCAVDTATIYYRPTAEQLKPPRKIIQPFQVLPGNGSWSSAGKYRCPYWNTTAPA